MTDLRCSCGALLAKLDGEAIELKCVRGHCGKYTSFPLPSAPLMKQIISLFESYDALRGAHHEAHDAHSVGMGDAGLPQR